MRADKYLFHFTGKSAYEEKLAFLHKLFPFKSIEAIGVALASCIGGILFITFNSLPLIYFLIIAIYRPSSRVPS